MSGTPEAGRRVLLLEDDPGIRHLVRRTLEREGYTVLAAGDFAEARQRMAEVHVDLLVLDYQLSGTENGLDFYRQLQAEGRDVPAILVTGFSDESRILEAMRAGLRDLIPKTPNFVELVPTTLERVFAQVAQERRLKEAEAASRAKDNFLATLSHELRTPLTPVLALVSAMRDDPRLPADLREDLNLINRNVTLEARLIDDLLDLTRIARGKLELRLETVDLTPLLEHALETSREGDLSGKNVVWQCDLAPGPVVARADPARLTQVFWNLLKNALKFTPEGGGITVTSRVLANDGASIFRVTVADTGAGIAPEALPRIFDAFEQGGRAITRAFGGLGLGLAISKALVDLHGGAITAQSAGVGQGALFTVELPLAAVGAGRPFDESPAGTPAADVEPAGVHLLLVEDHPDTAAIMERMLRRAGFRVTLASKVKEALRKVEEAALATAEDPNGHPIGFVVSDLGLPDGSGVELMAQLRVTYGLRGIALSGYGMEEDVRRAHEAGFLKHLTKPVEFGSLLATLREVLAQREEWDSLPGGKL
jgi:signal transduction histidine kinase